MAEGQVLDHSRCGINWCAYGIGTPCPMVGDKPVPSSRKQLYLGATDQRAYLVRAEDRASATAVLAEHLVKHELNEHLVTVVPVDLDRPSGVLLAGELA